MAARDNLLTFAFMLDDKKLTYYRTYDNILGILGNVGGLLQTLVFLAGMLVYPLSKISLNIELVNSFFSFEEHQKKGQVENKNNEKGAKVTPIN